MMKDIAANIVVRMSLLLLAALFMPVPSAAQTSLPKVSITYTDLDKSTFSRGTFAIDDGENIKSHAMEVRHRGALSSTFEKMSYAIKLCDGNGEKVDDSFLGLRSDNYWILDAMVIDQGRARTRVTMDLWLEFSRKPWYADLEPKMVNGFRGEMVELYVNGLFNGLYCLNERVDRKQLRLKKYSDKKGVQGVMYKSAINSYGTMFSPSKIKLPDASMFSWNGWEVKYPDSDDAEKTSWSPLTALYSFTVNASESYFSSAIGDYVDMPVLIDYILLCQLSCAMDNICKNMIVSYYDSDTRKAVLTPWDLDITWGRTYQGTELGYTNDVYQFSNLFTRLMACDWFVRDIEARYAELRQCYFTSEHIDGLFAHYFDLYAATDIEARERELWDGVDGYTVDVEADRAYIHQWVVNRLEYLDGHYHYQQTVGTGMKTGGADASQKPLKAIENGKIVIIRNGERYDIAGRKL